MRRECGLAEAATGAGALLGSPARMLTHRHPTLVPLACSGEKWKLTRNAWQPFFSHGSIARSSGLMAESAGRLCRQLGRPLCRQLVGRRLVIRQRHRLGRL